MPTSAWACLDLVAVVNMPTQTWAWHPLFTAPYYNSSMDPFETRLKSQARGLGFELAGIAPATSADGLDRLRDWLERGFAGDMKYMHRHAQACAHPSSILPSVRSVVMVGMNYMPVDDGADACSSGHTAKVARYARGA